jgi:hypothetical protein
VSQRAARPPQSRDLTAPTSLHYNCPSTFLMVRRSFGLSMDYTSQMRPRLGSRVSPVMPLCLIRKTRSEREIPTSDHGVDS